jgi:hypothetical protein
VRLGQLDELAVRFVKEPGHVWLARFSSMQNFSVELGWCHETQRFGQWLNEAHLNRPY